MYILSLFNTNPRVKFNQDSKVINTMERCIKAILSVVPLKTFLLNRDCVKENKLYQTVLSTIVEPLANELTTDAVKTISTNLIKVGVLYDTVYNRLHTGQWNAVATSEREMFTILTYVRVS